jgi:hypothetical protein
MRLVVTLILGATTLGFASSVVDGVEIGAIDKAAALAKSPRTQEAALFALERLAEGKPEAIPADLASQVGARPNPLIGWVGYRHLDVRLYAIYKLGETGSEDALAYLSGLKEEEFAPNPGERSQLQAAVHIAQSNIQLLNTPDRAEKVQLLEKWVVDPVSLVPGWAADQLCQMGSLISFPVVRQSIRIRYRGDEVRADDMVQFCLQRMTILGSNPDRTKALSSVLTSDLETQDSQVVGWAVNELLQIGSPDAVEALRNFSARVKDAPGLPAIHPLRGLVEDELARKASQSQK